MGCLIRLILVVISVLLALGILAAALMVGVNWGAPWWVEREIRSKTGFEAKIDSFSFEPWHAQVHLEGLVIENPANWPAAGFLDMAELRVGSNPVRFWRELDEIDELYLHVRSVTQVQRVDGEVNAEVFMERMLRDTLPPEDAEPAAPPTVRIRRVTLRLDTVHTIDARETPHAERTIDAGIHIELSDVTDVREAFSVLRGELEALGLGDAMGTLFQALVGLDFLGTLPRGVFEQPREAIEEGIDRGGEFFRNRLNPETDN